ncbi:type II toxin-antitoxin system YhaV family toxin [Neisseria wadsworthii]|uniref:YdbB like protein n=1 Tax=Neisseria wadsworthii 9715 TaxID=1030841 RepID=G4CN31_9NEIS|nr:type II toxin-antitoxin system YhaV family toxin [Neisseria wadsworthii]EGZ50641.1 YdbB like protein [Neisseria wadsworthii 9715]QMT36486.1 type II toxin-antitoxin system YhaV family toxin [Neisseria wadsworthii]
MPNDDDNLQLSGYTIYEHECFKSQLEHLAEKIETWNKAGKTGLCPEAKLLNRILEEIENIARNPDSPEYRLGNTLGQEYKHWRRAKFMGRYRLFFRYDSSSKIIILTWVNDSETKRTYGGKKDAYAIFKKMLERGNPPLEWSDLLRATIGDE